MLLPRISVTLALSTAAVLSAAPQASGPSPTFKQYCFQCHGKAAAMAGLNLEHLTTEASVGESFQHWEKVATALEQKRMPPPKMRQPSDAERQQAVTWIRARLNEFAQKNAGDPGPVTIRRLTSGEYGYTIRDLTGLDLKFDSDFATDSVGGEGFTNFGDVQFMQDANLERYLEAAKRVADHAVIGAGPITFFADPGKSGFELSAIDRIQKIYTANGFRAAAGEGGKPYGLERYTNAFFVSWQYLHRAKLGMPNATLEQLAAKEGLSPRFIQHIWSVVRQPAPTYPTSQVVSLWQKLPAPSADIEKSVSDVKADCDKIKIALLEWPRFLFAAGSLAAGGAGDERALVISDTSLQAKPLHPLRFAVRGGVKNKAARINLRAVSVNPQAQDKPIVLWRNARVRVRKADPNAPKGPTPAAAASQRRPLPNTPQEPLESVLDEATRQRLKFGQLPDGGTIDPNDFATLGDDPLALDLVLPEDAVGVELQVDVAMGPGEAGDAVSRITISGAEETRGRPTWALLANPQSEGYKVWRSHVFEFSNNLPQVSHGEPAPSDNDPIPAPHSNAYNQPERDYYHYKVKYYRQDKFLVDEMLDDATRQQLEDAWTDLLSSFEYHDARIRFISDKYKLNLKAFEDMTDAQLEAIPAEPREYIRPLVVEYRKVMKAEKAAWPRHVNDCLEFAARAWRRPLSPAEKQGLRSFYQTMRQTPEVNHAKAIRLTLARILVAPAFLYRLEQPSKTSGIRPLSNWEMASRLSYFLWSSAPDEELRRAATAGELTDPKQLEKQVKRMLADSKARRFSTEFFGQWLGFYRFDEYRGVDTSRFPEFSNDIKEAMYDEAVSFFEHIVRKDRPVGEIFAADYTFLNKDLAKHYGLDKKVTSDQPVLVEGAHEFQRGGALRLGAILTATSAPLRTSPVKRGDWVLRRILGTPTPPPPPDAGSIPADEKAFGGLSLFERLASHQRNPTCASCHARIDPMGFPLERYDAVGRWRDQYSDGKPIHDSSVATDKTQIAGVDGLLDFLKAQEPQVLRNLSNKLLGYALGRTVLGSDQPLIDRLVKAGGEAAFSDLITEVVTSRQFRYRREREEKGPASSRSGPLPQTARQANASQKEGGL